MLNLEVNLKVKRNMKIGELALATGVSASAIRFYEAKGVLAGARRSANGYRDYPATMVDALQLIRQAQSFGFSLEEIRQALPAEGQGAIDCVDVLASLRRKLVDVEAHLAKTEQTRARLLTAIASFEQRHSDGVIRTWEGARRQA
jgi:DNA-binding transcriptional MerR regulator